MGTAIINFQTGFDSRASMGHLTNLFAVAHADGWLVGIQTAMPSFWLTCPACEHERNLYNEKLRNREVPWDFLYDADAHITPPPDASDWMDLQHPNDAGHALMAYGWNQTLLRGRYNRYPSGGTYRSTRTFLGSALNLRGATVGIYNSAVYPGLMMEVDGTGALSSNCVAWLPQSGLLGTYWHQGPGALDTLPNGADAIDLTTNSHRAILRTTRFGTSINSTNAVINTNGSAQFVNVFVSGTTNQVLFGATNLAPSSAVAPTKWISVQVIGDATLYRLPLYQ
jgi:hypothetical protein